MPSLVGVQAGSAAPASHLVRRHPRVPGSTKRGQDAGTRAGENLGFSAITCQDSVGRFPEMQTGCAGPNRPPIWIRVADPSSSPDGSGLLEVHREVRRSPRSPRIQTEIVSIQAGWGLRRRGGVVGLRDTAQRGTQGFSEGPVP